MGSKAPKEKEESLGSGEQFEVKAVDGEENKYGVRTKKEYQREMAESKQNIQAGLLAHVWGDSVSEEDIRNLYIFDKKSLGSGHFGSVRRAKFICDAKRNYAVKTIAVTSLVGDIYLLKREIEILRLMDHPHIIKFFDVYSLHPYIHIVMEFCSGGTVLTKLLKEKHFAEDYAKLLMFQVFSAVCHLHDRGICHRDLRLDNFMIVNRSNQDKIKLIDFGLAKMFSSSELKTKVGQYHYVAPEIFSGTYKQSVDAWACGVMMYMMLTGEPPFPGKTPNDVFSKIAGGSYSTNQAVWDDISQNAKDLLKLLLEPDPNKRIPVEKAFEHAWFSPIHLKYNEIGNLYLKKDLLERLKSFKKIGMFQKEIIKLMVMIMDDHEEVERLKYVFFYLDSHNQGVLTTGELKEFFNNFGEAVSEEDLEDILKELNLRFKSSVTLTEFIAITIEPFFFRDDKNLRAVYNRVRAQIPPTPVFDDPAPADPDLTQTPVRKRDLELTGKILGVSLRKFGLRITAENFAKMLSEIKEKAKIEDEIEFEEFADAMKKIYN